MKNRSCFNVCFLLLLTIMISGCDNDTNELGADIIGDSNFETGTPEFFEVNANYISTGPVETLDLPVNALGIYTNPVFGTAEANLAVQLNLATSNPTFDPALEPTIDSVILNIPYFSERQSTNTDGSSTYKLDSIYGPTNSKIKLSIYESKYYIRDIDPQVQQIQRYYSDQDSEFDALKGDFRLNDSEDTSQNDQFFFNSAEIVDEVPATGESPATTVRSAPALRVALNKNFFTQKIINAEPGKLLNNIVFREYFRGLYFKVESTGADAGNLAMINIKGGRITIKYKQKKSTTNSDLESKELVLNLSGKSVGFFKNGSALPTIDDRVCLKGGAGSMAVIDLFGADNNGNGIADKLEELRSNNWLVNDASLTFYIDNNAMGSTVAQPNRIYLYDLNNKRPLVDYSDDRGSSSNSKFSKPVFGGIIKKSGNQGYYKIKLTNHIRALISKDSTNVKLGLVVTEDISLFTNKKLKTTNALYNISELPLASVINPLGTILFGSGENVPLDKRIRLNIYFTKPKQN